MRALSNPIGTILILLSISLFSRRAEAKYGGGSGTSEDPYQIATAADLITLGETPEDYDKHFILTTDIDLAGHVFDRAVIAPDTDPVKWGVQGAPFTGVFDGNGHTILHLTVKGKDYLGLFGQLGDRPASIGEVKELGVVDVNITCSGGWVGGLAGTNWAGSVTHCYSTGTISGGAIVGGLVGDNHGGVASDCYSTATLNGGSCLGGLVGENWGTVSRCYNTGAVSGIWPDVGGLVGYNCYGRITQCCSTGAVSGTERVGGLVGLNAGPLSDCYSTGTVSGSSYVGGLVGDNESDSDVTNCYSTGAVNGISNIGGMVGHNYLGVATGCFWDTQTSGQATSDGGTGKTTAEMLMASTFLGWGRTPAVWTIDEGNDYPRLAWQAKPGKALPVLRDFIPGSGSQRNPYLISTGGDLNTIGLFLSEWHKHFKLMSDIDMSGFDGKDGRPAFNIIGASWHNPFTGVFDGNGYTISRLTIAGNDFVGLFGFLGSGAEVENLCIADVNITRSRYYVGGLVGCNEFGTVTRCYSTGTVRGDSYVGGLVGTNHGDITASYSTGTVTGTGYSVGGLAGNNCYGGVVDECYSTGAVSGSSSVGGLVGGNWSKDWGTLGGSVTNCYSSGAVSGDQYVGGLVGENGQGDVSKCFWDMQTSGQLASDGGTGLTTGEMQTAATFLEAGWDFVNIWGIGENQTYPYLRTYSAADMNQDASVNFLDLAALAENWLTGLAP
jgi:hypothetical protein